MLLQVDGNKYDARVALITLFDCYRVLISLLLRNGRLVRRIIHHRLYGYAVGRSLLTSASSLPSAQLYPPSLCVLISSLQQIIQCFT